MHCLHGLMLGGDPNGVVWTGAHCRSAHRDSLSKAGSRKMVHAVLLSSAGLYSQCVGGAVGFHQQMQQGMAGGIPGSVRSCYIRIECSEDSATPIPGSKTYISLASTISTSFSGDTNTSASKKRRSTFHLNLHRRPESALSNPQLAISKSSSQDRPSQHPSQKASPSRTIDARKG